MPSIEARVVAVLARVARHPATTLIVLAVLPFLFFWRLFALNPLDRMQLPDGDLTLQYYPLRVFAARELSAGRLPLWNSAMYAGQPGLADSQMAVLYPPSLITALVLGLLRRPFTFGVLELQVVLHYALAAVAMYVFARRVTRSRFAAWIASLAFTFGGYLIAYPAQQASILAGDVWLPLVLWALHHAAERPDDASEPAPLLASSQWAWLAVAGAFMATSIFAGHPQTYIYVFYTAAAFWLYLSWRAPGMRLAARITGLTVFGVFSVALSAVQLVPTLEFTRYSTRAELGYAFTSGGFAPHELITLLVPGFFGGSPLYVGLLPLLLAGFALASLPRKVGAVAFWAALAAVALLLSLGGSSFTYALFYLLAPGFALVRDQERAAFLWSFALAMLAADGAARLTMDDVGAPALKVSRAVPAILRGALLVLGGLIAAAYVGALASETAQVNLFPGYLRQLVPAFFYTLGAWALWHLFTTRPATRGWAAAGAVVLVALNLFTVNGTYNFQKATPPNYFPDMPLTKALQGELATDAPWRVASEGLLPGAHNAGAQFGFAEINGNDPLRLAATEQFDRDVNELRRFQLLGARYVVTQREISHGAFGLIAQDGDARLYGYSGALPRAWIAHTARVVAPGGEADALNNDLELDRQPASIVVLTEEPPLALKTPDRPSAVSDIMSTPGRLTLNADAAENGMLVISEVYYPGWQATIDGAPARIARADGILMAIALPRGRHSVELTFTPDSVKIGALLTLAGAIGWIGVVLRLRAGRHRQIRPPAGSEAQ